MNKTRGLTEEAKVLDDFLKQYGRYINRKHALEAREKRL